jgi:hypothetical protein
LRTAGALLLRARGDPAASFIATLVAALLVAPVDQAMGGPRMNCTMPRSYTEESGGYTSDELAEL